jgi:hypothetical protein
VLAEVEVALKSFFIYMPFGVFTRPELKRELRRCAELGKPWPLVLAVIPSSARRKSSAFRVSFTLKGVAGWPSLAAPGRLLESNVNLDVSGYPTTSD